MTSALRQITTVALHGKLAAKTDLPSSLTIEWSATAWQCFLSRLHSEEVQPGLGEGARLVQCKGAHLPCDGHSPRVQAENPHCLSQRSQIFVRQKRSQSMRRGAKEGGEQSNRRGNEGDTLCCLMTAPAEVMTALVVDNQTCGDEASRSMLANDVREVA